MELDRFTTDELLTELKNRTTIVSCDITLASRVFKYVLVTHNDDHSNESHYGSFESILEDIEQPSNIHTFAVEAPSLSIGEVFSENCDDSEGCEYCLTIVRVS